MTKLLLFLLSIFLFTFIRTNSSILHFSLFRRLKLKSLQISYHFRLFHFIFYDLDLYKFFQLLSNFDYSCCSALVSRIECFVPLEGLIKTNFALCQQAGVTHVCIVAGTVLHAGGLLEVENGKQRKKINKKHTIIKEEIFANLHWTTHHATLCHRRRCATIRAHRNVAHWIAPSDLASHCST